MTVSTGRDKYREPNLKLYIRDVKDRQKKRPLSVRSWSTIEDVKRELSVKLKIPSSCLRLYFGPLLTSGRELPNHRSLHDAGIYRSGETLLLDIQTNVPFASQSPSSNSHSGNSAANDVSISSSMLESTPKQLRSTVAQARRGLALGLKPDLVLDGSGGTYFLHDSVKNKIAVFKPSDEEPYAENNPRGYLQDSSGHNMLRDGVVPGEACMREVAAFLLDHDGFSSVPQTTLVEASHPAFHTNGTQLTVSQGGASIGAHSILMQPSPSNISNPKKPGSFQEFVRSECTIDDMSPSKLSIEEVHKIAILDIRIMNADRNPANLLVRRKPDNTLELVPIDHGYCLRSVCDVSWMDWCWLDWPQMKEPLSRSHKKYIKNLDIEADAQMLREQLNICEEAVDYFRASSALLKAGVAAGLTLYDISILCCRNDNLAEVPSMMETLFDMANELALVAVKNDRWHHSAASSALVEQLQVNMPVRNSKNSRSVTFSRSVSNVEFQSSSERDDDDEAETTYDSPGMAHSSASETSNEESGDDCNLWAATQVAAFSEATNRAERCGSISSDEGDEALGFWVVPPTEKCDTSSSVQWSPESSPRPCCMAVSTEDLNVPPPLNLSNATESTATSTSKVTFAAIPTQVSFAQSTPSHSDTHCHLKRSRSYTALSVSAGKHSTTSTYNNKNNKSNHHSKTSHPQYRKYFHKFIDLVICRETTTVANKKH